MAVAVVKAALFAVLFSGCFCIELSRAFSSGSTPLAASSERCKQFQLHSTTDRRQAVLTSLSGLFTGAATASAVNPAVAQALQEESSVYTRRTDQFGYQFQPPPGAEMTGKPLKTHLDEQNWKLPETSLQFGITVDPVRIDSLQNFGTPEEVAAKVVLAEINRDGVFDVTLMKDPERMEQGGVLVYQLNYLSVGKRGKKRFVARFAVKNQRLYALTAQCKEEDYEQGGLKNPMQAAVESFMVL